MLWKYFPSMKQLLMENQPSSLHEHHLMFKHPYELLPFHEDNIWDNEPALVNSPTLWASHQQQETLLNSPMSKCNLDHFLLKETHMSNSLYSNCVSDPWQSMSGDEIQQLERAGMSSAICSDHHYMGKNPQSLEEDAAYTIEEDATRCSYLRSAAMSNASLKNEPPSCMPSSSAFFGLKALNMQETRAPTCNLVPHVCKPSLSSLLKPKAFNMEDNRAPCNLVPHASSASPKVSLSLEDQIMEMDHLMSLHDDGQSSLSDTASGIALVNASMLTSSPMFHMPSINEQLSSNFVQSQPFSSNLVQAPCNNNSVSHPSSTLAKLPSSSINYYHVNMEKDQILNFPNHSSSLSLLGASSIPSSLRDTKHYINLQHSSAPSSVPLSHPSTNTPGKLFHFANDQMMNNDQVQKNTEFSSSVSLNPVLNHRTSPKKHSMSPNQHSISLNEHSLSHNQHCSHLNDARKSAPCSDAALERTIPSMSLSSASDGDHHEPNEDPLEGTAKATMDDQVTVDQNSMNANEETKKLVQGEVHPSHIGDADNCSASHTPSLEALKIKKTSNKKGKKKKLQKRNRLPRIALVTQSENERLEDGFRWRKYGQKSVKNSPYPRSYYRCTTSMCSVKKRVERSPHDASMVITTYEGNHNHHTLPLARKSSINNDEYSYLNTTKPHLKCPLGRAPFATESFEYNYNANRYSLIMQLQDQHSYASSTHSPLPKLAYE